MKNKFYTEKNVLKIMREPVEGCRLCSAVLMKKEVCVLYNLTRRWRLLGDGDKAFDSDKIL